MKNAFILHGIYGNPEENWIPWLKEKLEERGYTVHVPFFPTTEPVTTLESWQQAWEPFDTKVDADSIVIGHSLGVAFALNILEKHSIRLAFLVATAWGETNNEFTPMMDQIANQDFDWNTIKSHCSHFEIFHADNDPYLPVEKAHTLAKHLECDVHLIQNAGHFNEAAGYTDFPKLLELIL